MQSILKKPAYYVTINEANRQQVEKKFKLVGIKKFTVILYDDLIDNLDTDAWYFCDEIHHAYKKTRVAFNTTTFINPLFLMGTVYKAILMTGHNSEAFDKFLKKHIGQQKLKIFKFGSLLEMATGQVSYCPKVICVD